MIRTVYLKRILTVVIIFQLLLIVFNPIYIANEQVILPQKHKKMQEDKKHCESIQLLVMQPDAAGTIQRTLIKLSSKQFNDLRDKLFEISKSNGSILERFRQQLLVLKEEHIVDQKLTLSAIFRDKMHLLSNDNPHIKNENDFISSFFCITAFIGGGVAASFGKHIMGIGADIAIFSPGYFLVTTVGANGIPEGDWGPYFGLTFGFFGLLILSLTGGVLTPNIYFPLIVGIGYSISTTWLPIPIDVGYV